MTKYARPARHCSKEPRKPRPNVKAAKKVDSPSPLQEGTAGHSPPEERSPIPELVAAGVAIAAAGAGIAALQALDAIGWFFFSAGSFLLYITWHRRWPRRRLLNSIAALLITLGIVFMFALEGPKSSETRNRESEATRTAGAPTATTELPSPTPNTTYTPSSAPTAAIIPTATQEEPQYIESETSKTFFEGALRISVVAMNFDGEPLRHTATVVMTEIATGAQKRVPRWETGISEIIGKKERYSITLISQGTYGATFEVHRR